MGGPPIIEVGGERGLPCTGSRAAGVEECAVRGLPPGIKRTHASHRRAKLFFFSFTRLSLVTMGNSPVLETELLQLIIILVPYYPVTV